MFKKLDAVLVKVPTIDAGLEFYSNKLGMDIRWKKDDMAAVKLGDSELVLSTKLDPEVDLLVDSVENAIEVITSNGGTVEVGPENIAVGKMAVIKDPFGNQFTLVDLSKGKYITDESHNVIDVG